MIWSAIKALAWVVVLVAVGTAFVHGFNKTIDIQERTYYDKELGRTVYVDEGV